MALTETVPYGIRPADARKPEFDPFLQWHRAMHKRSVVRVQRMAEIQAMRELLPKRLKVG